MPTSQEILGQLQAFQGSRRKPQDVLAAEENRLGVSGVRQRQAGLRGAIMNTENLLKNVDPSVTGRTQGSLVTEAQRTKMVANERAPIADQFTEQSRALEGESANLENLTREASTAAQLALGQDDQQLNYLQNLYGTIYQQERDTAERNEQIRQFNENLTLQKAAEARAAKAASGGGGLYGLGSGGGGGTSTPAQDPNKVRAQSAVSSLLGTRNDGLIRKTVEAIKKSAGFGNAYDRMKLQLIQSLAPQYLSAPKQQPKKSAPSATNPTNSFYKGTFSLR